MIQGLETDMDYEEGPKTPELVNANKEDDEGANILEVVIELNHKE